MPSKKKLNKLKSVENENLEEFADRVDNVDYVIGRNDLTNTSFFKFISEEDSSRDYTIIVDRSASMKLKKRWEEAEHAVKSLCAQTCKCDSDGISLYFFSSHSKTTKAENPPFLLYKNVATGEEVMKQFANPKNQPKGGTDLTKVLKDALPAESSGKPQSILIITDGCPDDTASAEDLIVSTINSLSSRDELSLTFIQVGDDTAGNGYLEELDNVLKSRGARFDVVDQVSHSSMEAKFGKGFSFADIVQKSILEANTTKAALSPVKLSEKEVTMGALSKDPDLMQGQSMDIKWGRIRDDDVKTPEFIHSKEYMSIMDAVKENSNERLKVEECIKTSQCPACKSMKLELDRILNSGHHSQTEHYLLIALASARESIANLDRANKDLLETLAMRHVDMSRVSSEAHNMHAMFLAQSEKMYKLEARMKTLQMENENYQTREKSHLLDLSAARETSTSCEEMISTLEIELANLRSKCSELQKEREGDKKALVDIQEKMNASQKTLKQSYDDLTYESDSKISALKTKLIEIEKSNEWAKESLTSEKVINKKLRDERDGIRMKYCEKEEESKIMSGIVKEKESQISTQINAIEDARQNIDSLKAQLKDMEANMVANDKTTVLASLKDELAGLSRQLVENNKEIYKSHELLEMERKKSLDLRMKIESLALANTSLKTELEGAKQTITEYKSTHQELKDRFIEHSDKSVHEKESLEAKIDFLENGRSTLNSEVEKAEQEIKKLRKLNEDTLKKNVESVQKVAEANHEIERLQVKMETNVSKLQSKVLDLERELKITETCRDDEVLKSAQLEKEMSELKELNTELQKNVNDSKYEAEKLLKSAKNDMDKHMKSRISAKDDEISRTLINFDEKFKQQSSEHKKQLETSAANVADVNRKMNKAYGKISEMEDCIESLKSKINDMEISKKIIDTDCAATKGKLKEMEESMKTTNIESAMNKKNLIELKNTKARLDDMVMILRQQNGKAMKDLKEALTGKRDAEAKAVVLTTELASARESLVVLQEDYKSFREMSRKALKDKNGEEIHEMYAGQIARLEKVNEQQSKEATEATKRLAVVEDQLRANDETIESLKHDLQKMNEGEDVASFHTNMLSMFGFQSTPKVVKKTAESPTPAVPGSTYKSYDPSSLSRFHQRVRLGDENNSPSQRKEKSHQESIMYIEEIRNCTKYDDLEPEKRPVVQKTRKGTARYFDLNKEKPENLGKYEKCALLIQRCGRGHIQRYRVRELLRRISHSIDIKIGFVTNLPVTDDAMASESEVFVLINTFRKIGNRDRLYSCAETRTIKAATDLVYEEDFRCASIEEGMIVINVMISNMMGPPSMVGQAILGLGKYPDLFKGREKRFLMPLNKKIHSVYDTTGTELFCDVALNPRGLVDICVSVPSISSNMCGWFWQIHDHVNRFGSLETTGSKMWVVLRGRKLYLYDNPFRNVLIHKDAIDCDRVLDIQEMKYEKLDLNVQGMKIILDNVNPTYQETDASNITELHWAWGEHAAKFKGLWRKAIIWHQQAEEMKMLTKVKVKN